MGKKAGTFRFKNTDQIGAAGAEEDEFLSNCFVDTGYLSLLENVSKSFWDALARVSQPSF